MTFLARTASYVLGGFIGGIAVGVAVTALAVANERQQRKQATT